VLEVVLLRRETDVVEPIQGHFQCDVVGGGVIRARIARTADCTGPPASGTSPDLVSSIGLGRSDLVFELVQVVPGARDELERVLEDQDLR
jgi:hypothetical protein